jgi:6-phosphogluconate dehydrogenase
MSKWFTTEYGDMQLIVEVYDVIQVLGMSNENGGHLDELK